MKRAKHSNAHDLVTVVDIGGAKAACIIASLIPVRGGAYEVDVLGVGQHGGIAADRNADAETSVRAAIDSAERMAGETVKSVYLSVGGKALTCRRLAVDMPLSGGVVTEDDIADCAAEGGAAAPEKNRSLHLIPLRYAVDGEPFDEPPMGRIGETMTAEVMNISMRESAAANAEAVLGRCGLAVDGFIGGPLAAANSVLIEDEMELGVMLIDLGARTTNFSIFERGAITACGGVSVGGDHVTRDIAQIFGAPLAAAERIKTFYGSAIISPGDDNRLVDVPQLGGPGEVRRHSRADISAVVLPRLEEIFELTAMAAERLTLSASSIHRVVLTGGGSLMLGVVETAEQVLSAKARLGRPVAMLGAPEAATAPQFSTALGVLQFIAQGRHGAYAPDRGRRAFASPLRMAAGGGLVRGVGAWLKSNF